jgi:decaprenylphospho-beta-D-ribofuranose 2-oxidase
MKQTLTSLDRAYSCETEVFRPDRYRQLLPLGENETLAAQGSATSYAAASFGGGARVVNMSRFNRLLGWDSKNLILEAEAGITLDKLFRFLTPLGYMVLVMSGHPQISLGGCIAANVHGKNQFRDGIFQKSSRKYGFSTRPTE